MNLSPVLTAQASLCDATGLESPGLVEVHDDGIFFTAPDLGTIGVPWVSLLDLLDNPTIQQRLDEAREDAF